MTERTRADVARDERLMDEVLPRRMPLSVKDFEAQGLLIPYSDGPCRDLDPYPTAFCRSGHHFQLIPADGCWRLRRNLTVVSAENDRVARFSCRCGAEYQEGDPAYPPEGCACVYSGQWFAFEACGGFMARREEAERRSKEERIEARRRELEQAASEEELAREKAQEGLPQAVDRLQRDLGWDGR